MNQPTLILSRSARQTLAAIHDRAAKPAAVYPVWKLLLTAVFMASAALTCAAVVILGAPGGGPPAATSEAVHINLRPGALA
jgi:hypothetical protein